MMIVVVVLYGKEVLLLMCAQILELAVDVAVEVCVVGDGQVCWAHCLCHEATARV